MIAYFALPTEQLSLVIVPGHSGRAGSIEANDSFLVDCALTSDLSDIRWHDDMSQLGYGEGEIVWDENGKHFLFRA